jgi:hypothetical protein
MSEFYRNILFPNFEPDQLMGEEEFLATQSSAGARTVLAVDPDGTLRGGLSGQWYPSCRILLLGYLAVGSRFRGGGVGASLLRFGIERWSRELSPLLMVGEVEDPRHHEVNEFGDPQRRFRFYRRFDAKALQLPYFQPALGPAGSRVPGFLLMVFMASPEAYAGAGAIDGAPLEEFLRQYLDECEGQIQDADPDVQRLLAACRAPGGVPLLPAGHLPP